jgi:hypothetical protein
LDGREVRGEGSRSCAVSAAKLRPRHPGPHRLSAAGERLRQVMFPAGRLAGSLVELRGGTNRNPSSRPLPSSPQNLGPRAGAVATARPGKARARSYIAPPPAGVG